MEMENFIKKINGNVYVKSSKEYENSLLDRWNLDALSKNKPQLIVEVKNENDIINSIKYCKENNIEMAVKGGGHGFHSNCKGLLLDLKLLKSLNYNQDGTLTIGAGCKLGEMDKENQKHGYIIPSGIVSDTGVCGLTLGGGIGHLSRSYGLTCDSLLQVKLITYNGEIKNINQETDPELLWALKGAGSNFGVVTEMKFKLNKLNKIYVSKHLIGIDENQSSSTEILKKLCNFIIDNQNVIQFSVTILLNSDGLLLCSIYNGDNGNEFLNNMNHLIFNEPKNEIQPEDFTILQQLCDKDLPRGKRYYKRGIFINCELDFQLINNMIQSIKNHPIKENLGFTISQLGGTIFNNKQYNDQSSFSFRNSLYHIAILTKLPLCDEFHQSILNENNNNNFKDQLKINIYDWTSKTLDLFSNFKIGDYSNINDSSLSTNNYYGENSEKLKQLKLKYDPNNFFNNNPNIN
ncbi:hypothetical protein ACTA71_004390 [Dictyostelium dimigraforme]